MKTINFYKLADEYGCFSNFSKHPVIIDGKKWKTTEHYFQAMKFEGMDVNHQLEIFFAKSPGEAAQLGRRRDWTLRPDWEQVKDGIMKYAVKAKVEQHLDVFKMLMQTGDAYIAEHTKNDSYWGDGGDGTGKNMLGKILMEIRQEMIDMLKHEAETAKEIANGK
jgi:hypothetical protein